MMRNLLSIGLAAVVLLLLLQLHSQSLAIKALQQTASSAPPVPSLELQEKCSKQAAAEYRQEGLEASSMSEFTNHYSAKLGRCFVIIKSISATQNVASTHKLLVDAYEGKVLGNYVWINSQGKKFWEVAPSDCTVTLPSGEEKTCQSNDEWDNLVKAYTETP
jgi:hypothetical protein